MKSTDDPFVEKSKSACMIWKWLKTKFQIWKLFQIKLTIYNLINASWKNWNHAQIRLFITFRARLYAPLLNDITVRTGLNRDGFSTIFLGYRVFKDKKGKTKVIKLTSIYTSTNMKHSSMRYSRNSVKFCL